MFLLDQILDIGQWFDICTYVLAIISLLFEISRHIQDSSSHLPSDIMASYDFPSSLLFLTVLFKALMFTVICKPSAPRSRFHVSANSAINASGESTGVIPR